MNKLFIASITFLTTSIYATDYNTTVTGPHTFESGDTITVNGNTASGRVNGIYDDGTNGGGGIQVNGGGGIKVDATAPADRGVNGVLLENGTANDLGVGSTIKANSNNVNGSVTVGINLGTSTGDKASLTADNLKITATNTNTSNGSIVVGLYINPKASATLSDTHITATGGGEAVGVRVLTDGQLTANNLQIEGNWDGMDVFDGGHAVLTGENSITINQANGGGNNSPFNGAGLKVFGDNSTFSAEKINIDVTGRGYTGIQVNGNGAVELGAGSSVAVHGGSAAVALDQGTFKAKGVILSAEGSVSSGAAVTVRNNSSATLDDSTIISDRGGVLVNNNSTFTQTGGTIQAKNSYGASAQSGGTANLNNVNVILSEQGNGLFATSNGVINGKNVTVTALTDGSNGITAQTSGTVNLAGNTTVNSGTQTALLANNGTIKTDPAGSKMSLSGNMQSTNGGIIDLTMTDGSVFTGQTSIDANSTNNLAMTGSSWNMTDNSTVSNLTLNNSRVTFNKDNSILTTQNLAGNGLFAMTVDLPKQTGNQLQVTGNSSGNHQLFVTNNGGSATTGNEVITLVKTADSGASFSLANAVEAGGYEYGLVAAPNADLLDADPNRWNLQATGRISSAANAASSFLNIGYLMNYIDNQTLLQRLGDLRNNEQGSNGGGFWVRGFGGKLSAFAGQKLAGFDMSYTGTQIGFDKHIDTAKGNLIVGAMVGLTKGNPNYRHGDGDSKNYHVGLYTTYLLDNGFYIDGLLKYNSTRNHFSVKDTAGQRVSGTGKTQGYSLSAEVGQRYWLASKKTGFYLEPQAQLTYGYQNGDTVHASNGLDVGLSHYNTTLGRASLLAGYQIESKNPINVYVKTGYVREFDSSASYTLNTSKNNNDFRGGWWDNGIGINANINKSHNVYADVSYAKGNRFDQKQINLGYRYNF